MPRRKKQVKKRLTKEQLLKRLEEIERDAKKVKELDAKIQRLTKEAIGTIRVM
jgi:hypothetical protein